MKRDLHDVRVETDDSGVVTGVLLDGQRLKGCTGIALAIDAPAGFLDVTLTIEAGSVEGLARVGVQVHDPRASTGEEEDDLSTLALGRRVEAALRELQVLRSALHSVGG